MSLPEVSIGYGVSISMQPNSYIDWLMLESVMYEPAMDAEIDVTSNGIVDWGFPSDTSYGSMGWQNRFAGDNMSNTNVTYSEIMSFNSGSSSGVVNAGSTNLTLSNLTTLSGIHSYDNLHLLCGFASCGQIVASETSK